MKGKILGSGLISGEDGNRYSFSLEDIQNLGSKDENALVNCEVDFEVQESNAKSIFITKSNFSVSSVTEAFGKDDLNSVKIKAYIYVAGSLLGFIPILGQILAIAGIICLFMAIMSIARISGISLMKNLILTFVFYFIGGAIVGFGILAGASVNDGSVGIAVSVVGFIFLIAGLVFNYLYYKGLTQATNEKFFFYTFICRVIGICTLWTIVVGGIFLFIGQILELIAWVKFKEIVKKES
ncbi:MAG: hypothetical protein J1E31_01660 [Helicobacter sp.]|nr:hypothetical protein [Helicobacter sp.]